ncbi:MAG: hypothetical protein ACREVR_03870 [Burkholderiales bacterium]
MMVKMKLVSYERYVRVNDGTQELTLAHGQEMDISAPDGKIIITGPSDEKAEAVKENVEAQDAAKVEVERPRPPRPRIT